MYTFSSKLRALSFILMALGLLGIGYGFFTAPKTTEDVEKILAADEHGGHHEAAPAHEESKHEATTAHVEEKHSEAAEVKDSAIAEAKAHQVDSVVNKEEAHVDVTSHEVAKHEVKEDDHSKGHQAVASHDEHKEHVEHVFHTN
jgi:hypothetical protein